MPTGERAEYDPGGQAQQGSGAPFLFSSQKSLSDGVVEGMVSESVKQRERLDGDTNDVKLPSPPTLLEQLTAAAAAVAANGKAEPVQGKGEELDVNGTTVSVSGELVSAADVTKWHFPNMEQLYELRTRLLRLMREHRLKQADVCRFTGLAAPYISFMVKDPSVANFSNRRRIEVYSILSAFFEKIDSQVVTPNDIAQLVFVSKATARAANSRKRAQHQLATQMGSAAVMPRGVPTADLSSRVENGVGGCSAEIPSVERSGHSGGASLHFGGADLSQFLESSKEGDDAEDSKGVQEKREITTCGRRLDKIERDRICQAERESGTSVSAEAMEQREVEEQSDCVRVLNPPYGGVGCNDFTRNTESPGFGAGQETTAGVVKRRRRGRPRGSLGTRLAETFYGEGEEGLEVDHNSWVPYLSNTKGRGVRKSSTTVLHGVANENHVSLSRRRRRRKVEGVFGGHLKRQELDDQLYLSGKRTPMEAVGCGTSTVMEDDGWRFPIVDGAIEENSGSRCFKSRSAAVPEESTALGWNGRSGARNTGASGTENGIAQGPPGEATASSTSPSTSMTVPDVSPLETVLPLLYECGLSHLLLSAEEEQEPGGHTVGVTLKGVCDEREKKRSTSQATVTNQEGVKLFSRGVNESDVPREENSSAVGSQAELYESVRLSLIRLQSEFNHVPRGNARQSSITTLAEGTEHESNAMEGGLRSLDISNGLKGKSAESKILSKSLLLESGNCTPLVPSCCEELRTATVACAIDKKPNGCGASEDKRFPYAAIPVLLCSETAQPFSDMSGRCEDLQDVNLTFFKAVTKAGQHESLYSKTDEKSMEADKARNDVVQWLFRHVSASRPTMDSDIQQQDTSSLNSSEWSISQTNAGTTTPKLNTLQENQRQLGVLLQALLEGSDEMEQKAATQDSSVFCSQSNFEPTADADASETPTKQEYEQARGESFSRLGLGSAMEARERCGDASEWAVSQRYFGQDAKVFSQSRRGEAMCSLVGSICFGPGWKKEVNAVPSHGTGEASSCPGMNATAAVDPGLYVSPPFYPSPFFMSQHSARNGSGDLTASASTRPSTDDDDTDELGTLSPRCSGLGTPDFFSSSLGCGSVAELPGFLWPMGRCDGGARKKLVSADACDSVVCALPRSGKACVLRFCWEHGGRMGDEDVVWDLEESEVHLECFVEQYAQDYHIPVDPVGRGLLQSVKRQLSAARSLEGIFTSVCQHLLTRFNFEHASHLPGMTRKILLDCFHQDLRVIDAVTWNLTHTVQDIKMLLQSLIRDLNLPSSFFMVLFPCFLRAVAREKVNFVYECGELMKKTAENTEPLQYFGTSSPSKIVSGHSSGSVLTEGSARSTRRTRAISPLKKDMKDMQMEGEHNVLDSDMEPIALTLEEKAMDEAGHNTSGQYIDLCGAQNSSRTTKTSGSALLMAVGEAERELLQLDTTCSGSAIAERRTPLLLGERVGNVSFPPSELSDSIPDVTVSCASQVQNGKACEDSARTRELKQLETPSGHAQNAVNVAGLMKTEEEPDINKTQGPFMARTVSHSVKTQDGDVPRCPVESGPLTPPLGMHVHGSLDAVDQQCRRIPFPLRLKSVPGVVAPRPVVQPLSRLQGEARQTRGVTKAAVLYEDMAERAGGSSQSGHSGVSSGENNLLPISSWISPDEEKKVRNGSCDVTILVEEGSGRPEGPIVVRNANAGPFNFDVMAAAALYPKICLASVESRPVHRPEAIGVLSRLDSHDTSTKQPLLPTSKADALCTPGRSVFDETKGTKEMEERLGSSGTSWNVCRSATRKHNEEKI